MDDIDKAFLDSILPDGAGMAGFVTVASWINQETGALQWRVYSQIDVPVSTSLGLLELAKLELIARSDTGLPIAYPRNDDDDDADDDDEG